MSTTGAPVMPATTAATCDSLYCSCSDLCRTCSAEGCRCFKSSSPEPFGGDAKRLSGQLLAHHVAHWPHCETLHALRGLELEQESCLASAAECVVFFIQLVNRRVQGAPDA